MIRYNPQKIEVKWQKRWERAAIYQAKDFSKKPKFYCLVEFPYPSGAGLHVGHIRSYSALDAVARKKRMQGYNVLYPMGWDAFGLPTENYAIKTKQHPGKVTTENIKIFRRQLKSLGLSFDWSREINTTDPSYYKWTQWIFLKLYEKGLAYQAEMPINWCSRCKIGLANEEVILGRCERCNHETIKRQQKQWMLKITSYAERLLTDLALVDYLPKIRKQQEDWIGRAFGAAIDFPLKNTLKKIQVFTTRPDTILGVTYLVLAPEHKLLKDLKLNLKNWSEIELYIKNTGKKSDLMRADLSKEKTGVELKGIKAINPANHEEIPIWIADYVLPDYGTGAIMAVPDHDQRDQEFAQKYQLPIKKTKLISSEEALKKTNAKKTITYKLRDWLFSRQHYWGEPIPIIHCEKCGLVPVPEKDLPVRLPKIEHYEPEHTGRSPLSKISDWVNVQCPQCLGRARRETDTMPNWAGSSWYFLRYPDPRNNKTLADFKKLEYWLAPKNKRVGGVDLYNGGMEHTTLHLLYARFWHKFLFDLEVVPTPEPFATRRSHGMVLASDGQKMSKSKGNVISPDGVIKNYGADTLRLYELFMGPFSKSLPWSETSLIGLRRFLERIYRMNFTKTLKKRLAEKETSKLEYLLHHTIKKVTEDIDNLKFNTAISQLMILSKALEKNKDASPKSALEIFLKLLAPFAPHLTEELWERLEHKTFIHLEAWPTYQSEKLKQEEIEIVVQINGRLRGRIMTKPAPAKKEILAMVLNSEKFKKLKIERAIFVPGKLINLVVSSK